MNLLFYNELLLLSKDSRGLDESKPGRHLIDVVQSLFQTSLPRTQVRRTLPLRSRTTRSASAPGRRVPFRFSMPRHRAGLNVAHLIASPREQPVKREKLRTQVSRVTTLGSIVSWHGLRLRHDDAGRTFQRAYQCPQDTT